MSREDEAFAVLSRRIVRSRGLVAGLSMLVGLLLGIALYVAVRSFLLERVGFNVPWLTMAMCMAICGGLAWALGRRLGRGWTEARLSSWVDELARRYEVERERLVELSSIWT